MPALAAAGYRVYAIDLIGFGLSAKPIIDYDSRLWREQCAAFLREVAGCGEATGRRAVVAGNSIGGYCALAVGAAYPELCLGVASLLTLALTLTLTLTLALTLTLTLTPSYA